MIIGVPRESTARERRVALVPSVLPALRQAGLEVVVRRGAGEAAGFPDRAYEEQGARLVADAAALYEQADLVTWVRRPAGDEAPGPSEEASGGSGGGPLAGEARPAAGGARPGPPAPALLRSGQVVVGLLDPLGSPAAMRGLAAAGVTSFALELLPRISRAQPMDALTSQATVGGYKAALMAAEALPRMYPMMITAAGTVTPARVFVIGAGVAGLQAIATSGRLGAVVHAYDIRPTVREQVESLGGRFVELELETAEAEAGGGYARAMDEDFYRRQRQLMHEVVIDSDVVITTAAVPGKAAPVLVTEEMVRGMRPGSVVVDLAAEAGGNCEPTRAGETVEVDGVRVFGPVDLPSRVPYHASFMYARNVAAFVKNLVADGELRLDAADPIVDETLVTHAGDVVNARVREALGLDAGKER